MIVVILFIITIALTIWLVKRCNENGLPSDGRELIKYLSARTGTNVTAVKFTKHRITVYFLWEGGTQPRTATAPVTEGMDAETIRLLVIRCVG